MTTGDVEEQTLANFVCMDKKTQHREEQRDTEKKTEKKKTERKETSIAKRKNSGTRRSHSNDVGFRIC